MRHSVLRHSSFFEHMEEFGYFREIEQILPDDFTAVFEIARVLEDESSALFRSLEPVLSVTTRAPIPKGNEREWRPNRNVAVSEEYEAGLMRTATDIKRIFPHQHLLPDEVFMRRMAQRSLWINVPRTPVVVPFKGSASDFAPDNFKQKVYLLLDTSTSMTSHHRIQMAKAAVYVFLKRNLKELGHIYLRTFDTDLGELHRATDIVGLRRLIHHVMRLTKLGNGTAMERAILQAIADIRVHASLSGAEILVVTDGACHLDAERIRREMGDTIRINTLKIGNAAIFADERELNDLATKGSSSIQRDLKELEEEHRRVKYDLSSATIESERARLRSHLQSLERRTEQLRATIVGRLKESYGREIETLSTVFVNIDDISADQIFVLRSAEIDEIHELLAEIELDFDEEIDADSLREAALLYEHVQMLLKSAGNPEQHAELEAIAERLRELLKDLVATAVTGSGQMSKVSRSDLHDLKMIMQMSSNRGDSLLSILMAMVKKMMGRLVSRRR